MIADNESIDDIIEKPGTPYSDIRSGKDIIDLIDSMKIDGDLEDP